MASLRLAMTHGEEAYIRRVLHRFVEGFQVAEHDAERLGAKADFNGESIPKIATQNSPPSFAGAKDLRVTFAPTGGDKSVVIQLETEAAEDGTKGAEQWIQKNRVVLIFWARFSYEPAQINGLFTRLISNQSFCMHVPRYTLLAEKGSKTELNSLQKTAAKIIFTDLSVMESACLSFIYLLL